MDPHETRRWEIDKTFEIDTKWAESVRQGGERIALASGAFLIAFPAFLKIAPGVEDNIFAFTPMVLASMAFILALFVYLDAMDAHGEASVTAHQAMSDARRYPIPLAMNASSWKRGSRVISYTAGFLLILAIATATVFASYQVIENKKTGQETAAQPQVPSDKLNPTR